MSPHRLDEIRLHQGDQPSFQDCWTAYLGDPQAFDNICSLVATRFALETHRQEERQWQEAEEGEQHQNPLHDPDGQVIHRSSSCYQWLVKCLRGW